jgi:hypothetical protein
VSRVELERSNSVSSGQWVCRPYEHSWSSQRQGLEHVRATADAAIEEHRQPAFRFPDDLMNSRGTSRKNLSTAEMEDGKPGSTSKASSED